MTDGITHTRAGLDTVMRIRIRMRKGMRMRMRMRVWMWMEHSTSWTYKDVHIAVQNDVD